MLSLAIETSTPTASVALGDDGALLAESTLSMRVSHSETVVPDIESLLAEVGCAAADLDAVVIGAGPGSFTGVRVAASLAKGLCFARGIPLYAYSGLLAAAAASGVDSNVCALFDARRDEVYAAAYLRFDPPRAVYEPHARPVAELLEALRPVAEWTFVGEGALRFGASIRGLGGSVLPIEFGIPRAGSLLRLAWDYPELGRVVDVATWEPEYVRASGAERALEA